MRNPSRDAAFAGLAGGTALLAVLLAGWTDDPRRALAVSRRLDLVDSAAPRTAVSARLSWTGRQVREHWQRVEGGTPGRLLFRSPDLGLGREEVAEIDVTAAGDLDPSELSPVFLLWGDGPTLDRGARMRQRLGLDLGSAAFARPLRIPGRSLRGDAPVPIRHLFLEAAKGREEFLPAVSVFAVAGLRAGLVRLVMGDQSREVVIGRDVTFACPATAPHTEIDLGVLRLAGSSEAEEIRLRASLTRNGATLSLLDTTIEGDRWRDLRFRLDAAGREIGRAHV